MRREPVLQVWSLSWEDDVRATLLTKTPTVILPSEINLRIWLLNKSLWEAVILLPVTQEALSSSVRRKHLVPIYGQWWVLITHPESEVNPNCHLPLSGNEQLVFASLSFYLRHRPHTGPTTSQLHAFPFPAEQSGHHIVCQFPKALPVCELIGTSSAPCVAGWQGLISPSSVPVILKQNPKPMSHTYVSSLPLLMDC